ncbi:hypothetical protein HSX11_29115 [Oxalobacteraceae bacterium]|nr:hypothetical protein [Oxalobacteraceae bacterium]
MLATILGVGSQLAHADGHSDLKAALERLQGHAPLKAQLETKTWRRAGEGKDSEETSGQASVAIEDGPQGMQLSYGREILARMDAEARAVAKNPNAKTPTLMAAREFAPNDLRPMISAAGELQRILDKATFKSEKPDSYGGKPARVLTFETSIETLSDRDRKYIKDFDGALHVWIGQDGTPLASRMVQNASGRAFIVITFEAHNEEQNVYGLVGDRLVALRRENKNKASGAGERDENKVVKTLQL